MIQKTVIIKTAANFVAIWNIDFQESKQLHLRKNPELDDATAGRNMAGLKNLRIHSETNLYMLVSCESIVHFRYTWSCAPHPKRNLFRNGNSRCFLLSNLHEPSHWQLCEFEDTRLQKTRRYSRLFRLLCLLSTTIIKLKSSLTSYWCVFHCMAWRCR